MRFILKQRGRAMMKRIAEHARILVYVCVAAAILNGCQAFNRGLGETVAPEKRRPLAEGGPHTGAWVTRDLVFSYEYVRQGDGMRVNGTVEFRGGVSNFPVMLSFYLQAYYLNAAGQVIAIQRIYNGIRGRETGTWRFRRNLAIPPEATGWAIGYSGRAKDYGPPRDSVDWSFWDTPFR
jgi:hypothetical protein